MAQILPSNNIPAASGNEDFSKDDILNFISNETSEEKGEDLLEEEKIEPKPKEEKEEEPEEKEKEELELIEEEKIEPDEEDLELVTPVRRQEILKVYPDLFKKFPYLEKAYYREQKYTEILPTIQDAQEAVEARDSLKNFETALMSGKTDAILKTVKDTDEGAFGKIVDDYLPALARIDRQAYVHVLGNVARNFITSMVREAQQTKNEDLQNAALILNQFAFGTSEFVQGNTFAKPEEKNPEKEKFEQERQHFQQERFTMLVEDLQTKFDNSIKATIVNHIDPRNSMTDYVKRVAIKDSQDELNKLIGQDSRYQTLKEKLWERAIKSNFSKQSVEAIRSAHLAKARTLLPQIIKKSRIEALKGLGKRIVEDKEDETPLPVGRSAGPRRSTNSGEKESPAKGKKTLDFFNED